MVNACRKPGEWQTYDIVFNAPRFDAEGKVVTPAYVTVLHNGVLVQNHTEVKGYTYYDKPNTYTKHAEKLPLVLMYHGDPVRFRNIWIREIKELEGKPAKAVNLHLTGNLASCFLRGRQGDVLKSRSRAMDKYRVTLTAEERVGLEQLVSSGKAAARKLTHARILLLADDPRREPLRRADRRCPGHQPADRRPCPPTACHRERAWRH